MSAVQTTATTIFDSSGSCTPLAPGGVSFEYRAAVALNNIGVSLMKKCCYGEGYDTLRDALFAMELAVADGNGSTDRPTTIAYIQDKLHQANVLLSRTLHQTSTTSCHDSDSFQVPLSVVSHDGRHQGSSCTTSAAAACSFLPTYALIQIDMNELDVTGDENEASLPFAIILYNLSIYFLCRGHTECMSGQCDLAMFRRYNQEAIQILTIARQLLSAQYEACEDPFVLPHVVFVSSVLIATLAVALQTQQRNDESTQKQINDCFSTLQALQMAAQSLNSLTDQVVRQAAAA